VINIVIPMAGRGSRFAQAGYTFPKPLIDVENKPMIQVVVDNIGIQARYIFLVLKEHYDAYALKYLLPLICGKNPCEIVIVDQVTEGAACTVLLSEKLINNDDELILANSDQWINWDNDHFLNFMRSKKADGGIVTFNACFSYKTLIDTKEFGKIPLGKIVNQKIDCSVMSYSESKKMFEYSKVKDFIKIPGKDLQWKKIVTPWKNTTYVTSDHLFLTENDSWHDIASMDNRKILTNHNVMSKMQREVFDGTMLGDGSISIARGRVNSGLKFSHSLKQRRWAEFKLGTFSSLGTNSDIVKIGKYDAIACRVNINEEFKNERIRWYPNDKKSIPNDLKLTPRTIAVWYMDDGGLTTNKTQTPRFATNSFTLRDIEFLQEKFNELNISTYTVRDNNQYRLIVSAESESIIFNMIKEYILPEMQYKLPEKYRGFFDSSLYALDNCDFYYSSVNVSDYDELKADNKYAFCIQTENENFIVDNLVAHNCHPKWSFAKVDEDGLVTEVAEKKPISNIATVGVYYFSKGKFFVDGAKQMISKNIRTNNEFYVCPVFNELIGDGKKVLNYPIAEMKGLGTPEDLDKFLKDKVV